MEMGGCVCRCAGVGSAEYVGVPDAYAAAAENYTLLIVGTTMDSRIQIDTKAVEVVKRPAVFASFNEVRIQNIPAGRTVLVRGISQVARLEVDGCSGNVLITDSRFGYGKILSSDAVTIKRSWMMGTAVVSIPSVPNPASLHVNQSTLLLSETRLNGQSGLNGDCGSGFCTTCCSNGGPGSLTLRISGGAYIRAEASEIFGGYGGGVVGGLGGCSCSDGPDGQSFWIDPGSTLELLETSVRSNSGSTGFAQVISGKARVSSLPRTVFSGGTIPLELAGDRGDTVFLLAGGELIFRRATPAAGVFQVFGGGGRSRLGSLPPTEQLTVDLMAPTVGAGEVESLVMQAVHLRPNGSTFLAPAGLVHVRGPGTPVW